VKEQFLKINEAACCRQPSEYRLLRLPGQETAHSRRHFIFQGLPIYIISDDSFIFLWLSFFSGVGRQNLRLDLIQPNIPVRSEASTPLNRDVVRRSAMPVNAFAHVSTFECSGDGGCTAL
jgi:hypothetical protein